MTSVMALDRVTLFLLLKGVTYSCKHMRHSPTIGRVLQYNGGKVEEAVDFKCAFVVYCVLESK